MFSSYHLRKTARESLAGNWPFAACIFLVTFILGAYGEFAIEIMRKLDPYFSGRLSNLLFAPLSYRLSAFSYSVALFILLAIIQFFFAGAARLCLCRFHIHLIEKDGAPSVAEAFSPFRHFKKAFLLQLAASVFIFLWSLLLVIPGIIARYRYALAPYLMAEDPEIGVLEALRLSDELMNGKKMELFFLKFSFIGWHLFSAFTLGLGDFYVSPYHQSAHAAFYLNVLQRLPLPANCT